MRTDFIRFPSGRGLLARSLFGGMVAALALAWVVTPEAVADGRFAPPGELAEPSVSGMSAMSGMSPSPNLPRNAQVQDQSAFALGSMRWNVVFVEGQGGTETWTAPEIANIQSKISQAEAFWEGMTSSFHPNAQLSINVNYVNTATPLVTAYEPSLDQSEAWVNQAMSQLGYTSASRFTNVRNFNQAERVASNDNWATTIFAVHNTNLYNTSYAYAYFGGPFTIVENDSAGWGPQNFNMVLSHEMGHIFMALDEYASSGARTTDTGGYLNVLNGNASLDGNGNPVTPPYPSALMLNNGNYSTHVPYAPSPWSSDMFGFRDTDSDGVPDILDVPPILTGSDAGSNPATGLFSFLGSIEVDELTNQNPLNVGFSNSQSDMTIDTIFSAYYMLDAGAPVLFPAVDGTYDDYVESLAFTISGLSAGLHTIDVFGFNNVGNQSNTLNFSLNVSGTQVPEPSTFILAVVAALLLGAARFGRRRK